MEQLTSSGTNGANNSAAAPVPSSPQANQENLGLKPLPPKALTQLELFERDRNAIAYSKSLLQEGDTLVFITYPSNTQVFDHTGFRLTSQTPFKVHFDKLLATGSKKFKELLAEWPQAKFKRRKGFFNGLPDGIKYIIDLTPPDEGDEAVELTSELSCSPGIRHWYSAEKRCNVSVEVCGGKDEIAKPLKSKPVYKNYRDLVDVLTDNFEPETKLVNEMGNYEIDVDEGIGLAPPSPPAPVSGSALKQLEEQQLKEALQRSKMDSYNHLHASPPKPKDRYESVDEVAEYCPIRHRAGIERLLQLIEGKEPRLDSAPKVWTLFVLAKYFDCTNVVVDFIVSWVLREPNCRFVEILPEATLRMGLGLKSAMLTRPAFAILVSEHALSTISRECRSLDADKAGISQFGRTREDIDEDTVSAVQAAAYSFISRVQSALTELCDPQMAWFDKLAEFQKITRIVNWANNSNIGEGEKELILDNAFALKRGLAHLVRGRVLWCFSREIWTEQNTEANDHRRAETYLKEYQSDFCKVIYSLMAEKEKMLTRYPWKSLRDLPFNVSSKTNLLLDEAGIDPDTAIKYRNIAKQHGVQQVQMFDLIKFQSRLNREILASVQGHGFNIGRLPDECFHEITTSSGHDKRFPEVEEEDDWGLDWSGLPATTYSPQVAPKSPPKPPRSDSRQDRFQTGMPDEMSQNFKFAAYSPSGLDFQGYLQSRKEGDMLERVVPVNSSASAAQGSLNIPLRPKDCKDTDVVPLLEKCPSPFGAERAEPLPTSGSSMINRITNIINVSTAFLTTQHKLVGPREEAIDLHNQSGPSTSEDPSFADLPPGSPTTPKKPISPHTRMKSKTKTPTPIKPAKYSEPHVPENWQIDANSPFFNLESFLDQVQCLVRKVANGMLQNSDELDFTVLTDTLLCLTDEEWKFLPLWAGGNEDGSGGVFAPMIPPAPAGAGPSGPGPSFHTGYSMASRSSTEMDFDGTSTVGESANTSVAVQNGYSDHFDRRRVMSEDDFRSEAFSDDTEDYVGKGKEYDYDMECDIGGNVSDDSETYVGKGKGKAAIHDSVPQSSTQIDSEDPEAEAEGEDDLDAFDDEEEAFDYGGEDEDEEMEDVSMTV